MRDLMFELITRWWKVVAVRFEKWYAWFGSGAATIVILTPTYVPMDIFKAPIPMFNRRQLNDASH